MVQNETKERVIKQKVGGKSMEDYMAEKLMEIEEKKVDLLSADVLIKGYKQLNVRHKNIIDAQRIEVKVSEFNNALPE
jgi:hypothetical protein